MYKYMDTTFSYEERVEDLLGKMTIREKVGQLNQRLYGFDVYERMGDEVRLKEELTKEVNYFSGLGVLYGLYRADPWSKKDETTGLKGNLAPKTYNQIQRYVIEHSRLSIPMMLSTECPHGHQALDGYLLPVNLAVGASFEPELFLKAAKVCGRQLKEMGVHLALVSALDVLRDPRWGRSEECYSEDPYLSQCMARAVVKGIQEEGPLVVAKHFCAQGETSGGVNASAARIGERELREIHLPSMKACCEEGVKGVMAAYNEIDGIFCHANKNLLTVILREEFGFEGAVMADGGAVDNLDQITGDNIRSGAKALRAGVDISLWDSAFSKLEDAVEQGFIEEAELNQAVRRVLMLKMSLGLFENPYIEEDADGTSFTYEAYPEALELARKSVVMLKNKGKVLPLLEPEKDRKVRLAVIGPNADSIYAQIGDYSPPIKEGVGITVLEGIKQYLEQKDKNQSGYLLRYHSGCPSLGKSADEGAKAMEEAVNVAAESDVVIMVLGGSSSRFEGAVFDTNGAAKLEDGIRMDCGEGVDCAKLSLPGRQIELFDKISKLGKKIITVLIQGRPYAIPEITEHSDALLVSFYPGVRGGKAIAEIIFGQISPSGRLPVSIPRHSGQIPVYYNHKKSYAAMNYYDMEQKSQFSFGAGFGYSEIKILKVHLSDTKITKEELKNKGINIEAEFTNTGNYNDYIVLQLYIEHLQATVVTRVRELKAFQKLEIKKGETVKMGLHLDESAFIIINEDRKELVEKGTLRLQLMDGEQIFWTEDLTIE